MVPDPPKCVFIKDATAPFTGRFHHTHSHTHTYNVHTHTSTHQLNSAHLKKLPQEPPHPDCLQKLTSGKPSLSSPENHLCFSLSLPLSLPSLSLSLPISLSPSPSLPLSAVSHSSKTQENQVISISSGGLSSVSYFIDIAFIFGLSVWGRLQCRVYKQLYFTGPLLSAGTGHSAAEAVLPVCC